MKSINDSFLLNDGVQIPCVGFGTFKAKGDVCTEAVKTALKTGYTHLDCAAVYHNEVEVGEGIQQAKIARDKLFVTSKVWNTERGYKKTREAAQKTCLDLKLDYLDLYLIHWPASEKQFPDSWRDLNADTWRALQDLKKDGIVRSIGISNFNVRYLEALLKDTNSIPSINQMEFHPGYPQKEVHALCKKHNILLEAWSPLARGRIFDNPLLKELAQKYNKTIAQISLKWVLQLDVLPLPKTVTAERIIENTDIFDFTLNQDEVQAILDMDETGFSDLDPETVDF